MKQQVSPHKSHPNELAHSSCPPIPPRSASAVKLMPKSQSSSKLLPSFYSKSHRSSSPMTHCLSSPKLSAKPIPQTSQLSSPSLFPSATSSPKLPPPRHHPNKLRTAASSDVSQGAANEPPPLPPRQFLRDKNHSYDELEANPQNQPHYDTVEPHYDTVEPQDYLEAGNVATSTTGKAHDYDILESTACSFVLD